MMMMMMMIMMTMIMAMTVMLSMMMMMMISSVSQVLSRSLPSNISREKLSIGLFHFVTTVGSNHLHISLCQKPTKAKTSNFVEGGVFVN